MSTRLSFIPIRPALRGSLGVLTLALLLTACSNPAPTEEPVRSVKIVSVASAGSQSGSEFSGEVRARVESRLGFRVAGKLIRRQAELGQHVKAGQVLAQIDPQDYKLAADAGRAQLAAATTNLALAAADYKRFKDLKDQNFISGAELDRRDAAVKSAQALVDQARAQLASQGNQSAYTSLVADVSGVVTAVEAEVGQVVSAGAPVVRIAQDGPRDVQFSVPEDQVAAVAVGSAVSVRAWAATDSLKGVVREVAASADPMTRTYLVKVALDQAHALALGSTATVVPAALLRRGQPVIKLPTSALRQDGKTTAVWVLEPATMTVRSQPVQIARVEGNEVVVSSGLTPGMRVVVAGVHVLSPGQKVTIYKEKVPVAPVDSAQAAPTSVARAAPAAATSAASASASAAK
jgi:multidrug efflux system membrane fusion protein